MAAESVPWSPGELAFHRLMRTSHEFNPAIAALTPQAAYALQSCPLLALGVRDGEDRPWATLLSGIQGGAVDRRHVLVEARVEERGDPVVHVLKEGEGEGWDGMYGALTIDLETRKRVKMAGRARRVKVEEGMVRGLWQVNESLGNCPKYINSKTIEPFSGTPLAQPDSPTLSPEAIALIARADLFFIATSNGAVDMDCNHRGGPVGFVRVVRAGDAAAAEAAQIIWPEYSGNRLYSTLGNLQSTPRAGIVIPDFGTGDVLYLTGRTETLLGKQAAAVLPRSNLAVVLTVEIARFVKEGLTFKGTPTVDGASPYNPPVRLLVAESKLAGALAAQSQTHTASLVSRTHLTPRITRYRFRLDRPEKIVRGQWVALDFSDQLDQGYSHMRDSAPLSLNDDYVRTFTVSHAEWERSEKSGVDEFELTVRTEGVVTAFMRDAPERRLQTIGVRGFGGDFRIKQGGEATPFVAGGVGITPLLAELGALPLESLRLFWTVRAEEVGLVADTFERYPGLAERTDFFLTGDTASVARQEAGKLEGVKAVARSAHHRRLQRDDLSQLDAPTWNLCTGKALRQTLLGWLDGKEVLFESFDF